MSLTTSQAPDHVPEHFGVRAGPAPQNRLLALGVSIQTYNPQYADVTFPRASDRLHHLPPPQIEVEEGTKMLLSGSQFGRTTRVLKRILRDVVMSPEFQAGVTQKYPDMRYIDLPNKGENRPSRLPGRQMGLLLSTILHSVMMKLFEFEPSNYRNVVHSVLSKPDEGRSFEIHNEYYRRMLEDRADQVSWEPEVTKIKRIKSRDQLAFVHREPSPHS